MSSVSALYPPVTIAGVTTSFLPLTTSFSPPFSRCASAITQNSQSSFVAWAPAYGISVETDLQCHPAEVTSWWEATRKLDALQTQMSLGPILCPGGYIFGSSSVHWNGSTYIGCCPSSYTFATWLPVPELGECVSPILSDQVLTYAAQDSSSSWTVTSTTITIGTAIYAIPVNGWDIKGSTSSQTGTLSDVQPRSALTIGLAVGIPLSVIGIASFLLSVFLLRRRVELARKGSRDVPMLAASSETVKPIEPPIATTRAVHDWQSVESVRPETPVIELPMLRDPIEIDSTTIHRGN